MTEAQLTELLITALVIYVIIFLGVVVMLAVGCRKSKDPLDDDEDEWIDHEEEL